MKPPGILTRDPERARAWRLRSKRLRPMSAKVASNASERLRVRGEVFTRDGWRCQFTDPAFGAHYGPLTVHHLRKASQGGAYCAGNLVSACSRHNDLLESDADAAALAVKLGLLIVGRVS